jgi:hypothetical protein
VVDGAETAGPVAAPSRSDDGVQPVLTVAPSAAPTAPAPASTPVVATGAATMTRSDAVRYLRELGPARAVQRLAVDLDGTTVAVRIDSAGTSPVVHVQVLDDPSGRLGATWTTGVERTLTQVVGNHEARFGGQPTHDQRRQPPRPLPDDTPTTNAARRWALAVADGGTHHD